jgi:CheY-like chemotaxis protein
LQRSDIVTRRVLVVEDSAVIRRLIDVCLRPADVEVVMREDGPGALEAALSERPDLMVLDIGLPEMDGWEVLDRLRSDPRTRSLPVLVLTAHAEEESRRRADEGGADGFVTKPFQPDELRREILQIMAGETVGNAV